MSPIVESHPLSATAQLLSAAEIGLAVCGPDGEVQLMNEHLRREVDANQLDEALRLLAAEAAAEGRTGRSTPLRRALAGSGSSFDSAAVVEDGAVIVVVAPARSEHRSLASLRQTFGLTEMQTRTALLLARRLSNREIAEALEISPHTARHHTEKVLRKLGVRSRKDVAGVLGLVDMAPP